MHTMMLKTRDGQEVMLTTAHALRPARIVREELRHFTGTTFPDGAYEGCALTLRRMDVFGMIADGDADQWVDVLDENGDILHEVPVTPNGFKYLRRVLGSRLEVN
jgi:hypothetical protein